MNRRIRAYTARPKPFLVLVGFLIAAVAPSLAQTSFMLGVGQGNAGSDLTIPLQLESSEDPVAFQCEIVCQGTGFTMQAATVGPTLSNHTLSTKLLSPTRQRLVVDSSSTDTVANGIAVTIPFSLEPDAESASIAISVIDLVVASKTGDAILPESATAGTLTIGDGGQGGGSPDQVITQVRYERASSTFTFSLGDEPGTRYRIEQSDDLKAWTTARDIVVNAEGELSFSDADADAKQARWYRGVRLP